MKNTKMQNLLTPGGAIDWAAWEAEHAPKGGRGGSRTKGRKFDAATRARFSEAQRKQHARKRQALAEAVAILKSAEPPKPAPPHRQLTVRDCILAAMEPGRWYSTRDIANASGQRLGSAKAQAPFMWREGWLERAQNEAWRPVLTGQRQEPKWLYRLSPAGEQRHRLAVALH